MPAEPETTRPLTSAERALASWMLTQGAASTAVHHQQLERAVASTWRCPCGCASFNIVIPGAPDATGGMAVLGDFVFGADSTLSGAFIFARDGVIRGVAIYGLAGDAPRDLPSTADLRPFAGTD